MSMKIQGTNMINRTNPYSKNQSRENTGNVKNDTKDQLSISTEAKAMLDQLSGSEQLARKAKVAELKQQVASGTYQVEAGKVAEKLLEWWK